MKYWVWSLQVFSRMSVEREEDKEAEDGETRTTVLIR